MLTLTSAAPGTAAGFAGAADARLSPPRLTLLPGWGEEAEGLVAILAAVNVELTAAPTGGAAAAVGETLLAPGVGEAEGFATMLAGVKEELAPTATCGACVEVKGAEELRDGDSVPTILAGFSEELFAPPIGGGGEATAVGVLFLPPVTPEGLATMFAAESVAVLIEAGAVAIDV